MKKSILLNSRVSSVVSLMGHTDSLTIGDAGLPISDSVERIDLAVKAGLPPFIDVLAVVLKDLCIERVLLAEEIKLKNSAKYKEITNLIDEYRIVSGYSVRIDFVSHNQFKKETEKSKAVLRTGEVTPYANIILYSGVFF